MAVLSSLLPFASAADDPAPIYGKWRLVHSNTDEAIGRHTDHTNVVMEFRRDGSLILTEDGVAPNKCRFELSGKHLRILMRSGSLDKTVEFSGGDKLRLIQGRQGVSFLQPIVDDYKRVPQ